MLESNFSKFHQICFSLKTGALYVHILYMHPMKGLSLNDSVLRALTTSLSADSLLYTVNTFKSLSDSDSTFKDKLSLQHF